MGRVGVVLLLLLLFEDRLANRCNCIAALRSGATNAPVEKQPHPNVGQPRQPGGDGSPPPPPAAGRWPGGAAGVLRAAAAVGWGGAEWRTVNADCGGQGALLRNTVSNQGEKAFSTPSPPGW